MLFVSKGETWIFKWTSIYFIIHQFLYFSSYFWGNLVTDWNRQLLFLFPSADISMIHCGVGKPRNSCILVTRYENDMYLVLRSLCWWLRGSMNSFNSLSSIYGNGKDPSKGNVHCTRQFFTFLLVFNSVINFILQYPGHDSKAHT